LTDEQRTFFEGKRDELRKKMPSMVVKELKKFSCVKRMNQYMAYALGKFYF